MGFFGLIFLSLFLIIIINLIRFYFSERMMLKKSKELLDKTEPSSDPILFLSAIEIAEGIKNRKFSCEKVVESFITQIEKLNPALNSVIHKRYEEARKEAKGVDKHLQNELNTESFFFLLFLNFFFFNFFQIYLLSLVSLAPSKTLLL